MQLLEKSDEPWSHLLHVTHTKFLELPLPTISKMDNPSYNTKRTTTKKIHPPTNTFLEEGGYNLKIFLQYVAAKTV